jgi:hypothetical protein
VLALNPRHISVGNLTPLILHFSSFLLAKCIKSKHNIDVISVCPYVLPPKLTYEFLINLVFGGGCMGICGPNLVLVLIGPTISIVLNEAHLQFITFKKNDTSSKKFGILH